MMRVSGLFLGVGLLCGGAGGAVGETVIRLDTQTRFQTFTGWEVTAELDVALVNPRWPEYRLAVIEGAIDMGITRVRLEIGSGAENRPAHSRPIFEGYMAGDLPEGDYYTRRYVPVNDNDDPRVIDWSGFDFAELDWSIRNAILPMRAAMEARGERLHVNLCYVSFTDDAPEEINYLHSDPEEYAEFVLATHLYMQETYGFVPDTWEIILEPDLVPAWNPENGRVVGRAIAAAGRRLEEAGFTPRFVAPSVTNMDYAVPFTDGIASVPGAIRYVSELSYHRYWAQTEDNLRAIAAAGARYGKQTAMLEWWFDNATYEILHQDLKIGNVSAWQNDVLGKLFLIETPHARPDALEMGDVRRMTLPYYQAIRPGAVRVAASSSDPEKMDPLGFVYPDGRQAVVVKATARGALRIEGLPPGRYALHIATDVTSERPKAPLVLAAGEDMWVSMPGAGALSIVALP